MKVWAIIHDDGSLLAIHLDKVSAEAASPSGWWHVEPRYLHKTPKRSSRKKRRS